MWRSEKAEYLKDGRDYSSLLDVPVQDCEPSREKQDFLRRRQKLEELLKSKQKSRGSSSRPDPGSSSRGRSEVGSSSQRSREDLPFDKTFGSFFGPSEPVLARSYVERQRNRDDSSHAAARSAKQKQVERRSSATTSSKPVLKSKVPARPVPKIKQKAQKLKEARDYSFLFSEGGDAASQVKVSAKERTGYATQPGPSKPSKDLPRPAVSSSANRKLASQPAPKQQNRASETLRRPLDQSKQVKGSSGRDNGRQKQPVLSKSSKEPSRSVPSANQKVSRPIDASRRPVPSGSSTKQKLLPSSSRLPEKRSSTSSKPVDTRRPLPTNQLKRPAQVAKRPEYDRQPAKRSKREDSPTSSFLDDDEDSYENYRSLLPPQFRMKSRRVPEDEEYDSSDMEVGFSTIQQEEARSARIAREEDERERVLIEEEERLERERLRKKQRR